MFLRIEFNRERVYLSVSSPSHPTNKRPLSSLLIFKTSRQGKGISALLSTPLFSNTSPSYPLFFSPFKLPNIVLLSIENSSWKIKKVHTINSRIFDSKCSLLHMKRRYSLLNHQEDAYHLSFTTIDPILLVLMIYQNSISLFLNHRGNKHNQASQAKS